MEATTTAAAPVTESAAPTSTADIAASVIDTAERESPDTGTESAAPTRIDTTNAHETAPVLKTEPTQAELSAAAKFLVKQGHQFKKVDGRDTWLPVKTVEGMLERYVEEHRGTWTGERTTLEGQTKELRSQLEQLRTAVGGDPKAFLAELAGIDPRYKSFLGEPAPARTDAAADTQMPEPDITLSDGSRTYSLKGLQSLLEWNTKRVEAKMDERLKPLTEREEQAKQRDAHERTMGEIRDRSTQQMQEAQTWPHFGALAADGTLTEFQQAVLDELKKDSAEAKAAGHAPKLSLEGAYIRIAGKRFTEDDATRRERIIKEISAAPKSTALSRQSPDATAKPAGAASTADIARSVIAKLEHGA